MNNKIIRFFHGFIRQFQEYFFANTSIALLSRRYFTLIFALLLTKKLINHENNEKITYDELALSCFYCLFKR